MDVHTDAMAVADVAHEHGAEVTSLGIIGTRPCDIDHLLRKRPSKATPLIFVYDGGPVATGSTGIASNKATTAGWWRRL